MLKIIKIFYYKIKYQKYKYWDIFSDFSCFYQAYNLFILSQNMAPV